MLGMMRGTRLRDVSLGGLSENFAELITEDWESGLNGWTVLDDPASANQWEVGTAIAKSGSQSIYISDDGGASHDYNTSDSAITHAYKDFDVSASTTVELEFDWLAEGESTYDYLTVHIMPDSVTPSAGSLPNFSYNVAGLFQYYNGVSTWQHECIDVTALCGAGSGGSFRLCLTWTNDGSLGTQPPTAVDNISITEE